MFYLPRGEGRFPGLRAWKRPVILAAGGVGATAVLGYINGIARRGAGRVSTGPESSLSAQAAWGRDDVLGCERSLYAAVDQGCPFVSTRRVAAADVSAPDWRTCSPAPR